MSEPTTTDITIKQPDGGALTRRVNTLVKTAEGLVVKTKADYDRAFTGVQRIDATLATDADIKLHEEHVKTLFKAHRQACTLLSRFTKPLLEAKRILLNKRVEFEQRIAREDRERQDKLLEEAKRKQLKDAERDAKKFEKQGQPEVAEQIREQAATTAPIAPPPAPPMAKTEGEVDREVWLFKVVNPAEVPDKYRVLDESLIGKDVRNFKDKCQIPGVYIWMEKRKHTVST